MTPTATLPPTPQAATARAARRARTCPDGPDPGPGPGSRHLRFVADLVRAPHPSPPPPEPEPGDDVLLRRVGEGDRQALRTLHDRHAPWLTVRLQRRCRDRELVDEAVQDTFLAVWRSAGRYRGDGQVAAWIWGIGVRRLIDRLRRSPRGREAFPEPAPHPSAEDQALDAGQYGEVGAALRRLQPDLRAVLQATVLDGLTTREAAVLLGIPAGTVKTRAMRARKALREELG